MGVSLLERLRTNHQRLPCRTWQREFAQMDSTRACPRSQAACEFPQTASSQSRQIINNQLMADSARFLFNHTWQRAFSQINGTNACRGALERHIARLLRVPTQFQFAKPPTPLITNLIADLAHDSVSNNLHLAARVLADGQHARLLGVHERHVVRLRAPHHGGLDLVHPGAPKAAAAAATDAALPLLEGDAPARDGEVTAWQEGGLGRATCRNTSKSTFA